MKFIVVSDVHIHPWLSYSKIDDQGVPSRLKVYEQVAVEISHTALKEQCEYCVIPGDFLNSPENRPMTLITARNFLRTIASECKIILTDGQHDMDTKSKFSNPIHSIASLFSKSDVEYIHDGYTMLGNHKAYVHGWDPEGVIIEKDNTSGSTIYIGHGVVQGSSTPDGYVFTQGVPKEDLFARYKLSIIGDIHNGVIFNNNKFGDNVSYIMVPGPPVQNSFKDPEKCGYWVVDIHDVSGQVQSMNFVPLSGPPYHRFLTVEEGHNIVPDEFTHLRVKSKTLTKSITTSSLKETRSTSDIATLINNEVQVNKPVDPNLVRKIIDDLISSITLNNTKNIPETYIKEIEIEGFGNIKRYSLRISDLPAIVLILGANGSGKSTLLEAIYWVLTGSTSKGLKVDKVVNRYHPEGCYVGIKLDVNDEEVIITRSRAHRIHGTALQILKNNKSIEKSSTADTQNLIYSVLGLSAKIISTACYLSARNLNMFGDLSASDKNDLLSLLADTEVLEALRTAVTSLVQEANSKDLVQTTEINSTQRRISDLNYKIQTILTKPKEPEVSREEKWLAKNKRSVEAVLAWSNFTAPSLRANLESLRNNCKSKIATIPTNTIEMHDAYATKLKAMDGLIDTTNNTISSLQTEKAAITTKLDKLSTSVCFTCKQHIVNEDELSKIKKELSDRKKKIYEDIDTCNTTLNHCNNSYAQVKLFLDELTIKKNTLTGLNSELTDIQALIDDLDRFCSIAESPNTDDVVVKTYRDSLVEEQNKLVVLQKEKEEITASKDAYTLISKAIARNGPVVKKLLDKACEDLSSELVQLLDGSKLSARIEIGKEISPKCTVEGEERDYEELSGGEKQIVDLAILIAFNNALSLKYGQSKGILGLIALDEVFSYLDPLNAELANQIINKSVAKLALVVTHDSNLQAQFTNVLNVTKQNNIANYELLI